jgi:hypothetical protein
MHRRPRIFDRDNEPVEYATENGRVVEFHDRYVRTLQGWRLSSCIARPIFQPQGVALARQADPPRMEEPQSAGLRLGVGAFVECSQSNLLVVSEMVVHTLAHRVAVAATEDLD